MFKRILVAYDGSEGAKLALAKAWRLLMASYNKRCWSWARSITGEGRRVSNVRGECTHRAIVSGSGA